MEMRKLPFMVFLMATEEHILLNIGSLVVAALSFSRNHLLPILLSQPEYKGKDVGIAKLSLFVDNA